MLTVKQLNHISKSISDNIDDLINYIEELESELSEAKFIIEELESQIEELYRQLD